MNIDDQATANEELVRELAIQARRPAGPAPIGCCFNCGEPVPHPGRWCDSDCFTDWQARTKRRGTP